MRLWPLILGLLAVLVVGCQERAFHAKFVRRDHLYRSAISLSPGTTELISGKIMSIRLLGRTSSCNFPVSVGPIPVVMNGVKPNFEKIISLRPDVIVYDPALFSDSDLSKFKEAKIPVFAVGATTLKDFIRRMYEFGAEFATETAIMTYVGDIEAAETAASAYAPKVKQTAAILMPDERGGHMIAGTKSFVADVARVCGADVVGPESTKFEKASIESLLSWNPAIIICSPKYEWIVNDARLQSLSAVQGFKQGKSTMAQINGDLLLRQGARVDILIKNVSSFVGRSTSGK